MAKSTAKKGATSKAQFSSDDILVPGSAEHTQPANTTELKYEPALKELFTDGIKDIYWAENHLIKALPKMEKAATSSELKQAIINHLEETKTHVTRLEQVFSLLGEEPKAKKCDAMEGITLEGEHIIEETPEGSATRDVGIILSGQKVEHYEIATYGGLAELAKTLGLTEVAALLEETLAEEKLAAEKLTEVARSGINYAATSEA